MAEVASERTLRSAEKPGGAQGHVAASGEIWQAGRNHLELLGTCQHVSRKRAQGTVLKAAFTLVFTPPRPRDLCTVLVLGSRTLSPSLLQPLQ